MGERSGRGLLPNHDRSRRSLRVVALGELTIALGDERIERRLPDKAAMLVAYLADVGGAVGRSTLAGLLWSDVPEARARSNLRVVLTRLKAVVGGCVQADRDHVWISCDLIYDAADIDGHADAVVERYRGDFLEGVSAPGAELFEDWAAARRQSLRASALLALSAAAADSDRSGDSIASRRYAQRIVEIEPWNEAAHRQLLRAIAATSGAAAARAHYDELVGVLDAELGLAPSLETDAVLAEIQRAAAGPVSESAPAPSPSVGVFGAPTELTPFFGREWELGLLVDRLTGGGYRLFSVVGPGGVGKTRVALEAARTVAERFSDGVFFVGLAAAVSRAEAVADLLSVVAPGFRQSAADPFDRLVELIGGRQMCVVLDNVEQIVDDMRPVVVELLQRCGELRVIVTSRQPLDVSGEDLFELGGLPCPEPGTIEIDASPAVRLFADRAYRADKSFSLADDTDRLVRLCRLLEGVPLHLELVAARVGSMSVAELEETLRSEVGLPGASLLDAPERHRTFDAVFEQSWITLDHSEQQALAALSVTRGGFDEDAARALLRSDGFEPSSLARKSLLVAEGRRRFRFHELLRQSASSRLHDRTEIELRHARLYLGRVADASTALTSRNAGAVSERLLADLDNVRIAWSRAIEHSLTVQLGGAAQGVALLFEFAGRRNDAFDMLSAAAAASATGQVALARAPVSGQLIDEAYFLRLVVRYIARETVDDTVDQLCDRLDALLSDAPDRRLERAWSDLHRAQAAFYRGDLDRAREFVGRTEATPGWFDDVELRAWTLTQQGRLLSAAGDFDASIDVFHRALELFSSLGDASGQGLIHSYLAPAYAEQNMVWEAYESDREAMELGVAIGNRHRLATLHDNVGASLVLLGEFELARQHTATSLALLRACGDEQLEGQMLAQHAECLSGLGLHEEAERDFVAGIAINRRQGFSYALLYNLPPWIRHLQQLQRHDEALLSVDEFVGIAVDRGARHFEITGRALRARSLAAMRRAGEAVELADSAWEVLNAGGAPPLPWPVATFVDLASVYLSSPAGGAGRCREAIDRAVAIQTETARSIADPALRHSYLTCLAASRELAALRAALRA